MAHAHRPSRARSLVPSPRLAQDDGAAPRAEGGQGNAPPVEEVTAPPESEEAPPAEETTEATTTDELPPDEQATEATATDEPPPEDPTPVDVPAGKRL